MYMANCSTKSLFTRARLRNIMCFLLFKLTKKARRIELKLHKFSITCQGLWRDLEREFLQVSQTAA